MLDRLALHTLLALSAAACSSPARMSVDPTPDFDVKVVEREGSSIVDLKVVRRMDANEVVACINGRWLDVPERRTVQFVALDAQGAIVREERQVATLAWDALPKSGMDRAHVSLEIPQDPRIATIEVRLLTEWQ